MQVSLVLQQLQSPVNQNLESVIRGYLTAENYHPIYPNVQHKLGWELTCGYNHGKERPQLTHSRLPELQIHCLASKQQLKSHVIVCM